MGLPPPYPHQTRSIGLVRRAYAEGARRIVLVLPCGAGKTRTGTEVFDGALKKGRRVLWLAHREELVDQAASSLAKLGAPFGIIKAGRPSNPTAPIQVASVQTLHARPQDLPPADVIVSDECHHDKAKTREVLFGRFPHVELVLGLTATPERGDRQPLGESAGGIYQRLVVGATVEELQRTTRPDGFPILVQMRIVGPKAYQPELWKTPVQALLDHARRPDGSFRPAIHFAGSVEEAHQIAHAAKAFRIRAAAIDGTTPALQRKATIDRLAAGDLDVLVNVNIATEGFDCPRIEVVGVGRGCSAESTWIQMIMRGARSSPETGKRDGLLIDFRGISYVHGTIDDYREYSLDGKAINRPERVPLQQCASCGAVFKPADNCPSCLMALPKMRRSKPKVKTGETVEITKDCITPMHEKHAYFVALCDQARARGWKPAAVGMRFKARFGHWFPASWAGRLRGAA